MRQEDLDGCHEIVKVGESTAISATCDAVLNVFINSEFTLFPTCVRAWIFEVHLLSSFHVANVDPHVLARRSQEGSVVAETDRSNLKKKLLIFWETSDAVCCWASLSSPAIPI